MTTQAKNRILALLILGSLFVIFTGALFQSLPPLRHDVHAISTTRITVADLEAAPKLNQSEFECLRANVYFEARTESLKGMQAVAFVTVNRSENKHYPNSICGVVRQSAVVKSGRRVCQFSWMCDGKPDQPNLRHPAEARAWAAADTVARAVMEGKVKNFLAQATHYHASYVHPSWRKAKRFQLLTQIGAHLFYKDKGLFRKA